MFMNSIICTFRHLPNPKITITPAWYLPPIFDSLIVLVNMMQFSVPKVGLTPLIIYHFIFKIIIVMIRTILIIGSLGFAHVAHCSMYIVDMKDRAQKNGGPANGPDAIVG
ncbi:LOW QUALITY PROTEIN: hypothetical protein TorRG33x02_054700 [Trema orientale]|uniref:Uncharacterized protein n=1 Tax=Trema orientale TaxID=63057 RepID=A0A2P5FM32_TREOI|nr:LOW QUALITY PROTEIN: hypothetical protein TorRG33x02_054700 [Trema orientale]